MFRPKEQLRRIKQWVANHWDSPWPAVLVEPPKTATARASAEPEAPLADRSDPRPPHVEEEAKERVGTIAIDASGAFQITNPTPASALADRYAVLIVPEVPSPIVVHVNQEVRSGEVVVQAGDVIRVASARGEGGASFHLSVNEAATEALVTVAYEPGERVRMLSHPPSERLTLQWTTEPMTPSPICVATVVEAMDRAGIVYGRVDEDRLAAFLAECRSGSFMVASTYSVGLPFGCRYRQKTLPAISHERPGLGGIDDWVEAGTVVGVLDNGYSHRPRTVTGRMIAAKPWRLGNGVGAKEGERHLVAEHSGRMEWTERGVEIFAEQRVAHDLTAESSPLVSSGDVVIEGSVASGLIVAEGMVVVTGDVVDSEIHAGRSVIVLGDTRQSMIYAGARAKTEERFRARMRDLAQSLLVVADLYAQCEEAVRQEGSTLPSGLLARLVSYKFPDLSRQASRLWTVAEGRPGLIAEASRQDLAALTAYLRPDCLQDLESPGDAVSCAERLLTGTAGFGRTPASGVAILCQLGRVRDAEVYVDGSVRATDIRGGTMEVTDTLTVRGSVRGGHYVVGRLHAADLGGQVAEETVVTIRPEGALDVSTTHPGVVIHQTPMNEDGSGKDLPWEMVR